jgi:hypothetical protein
MRLSHEGAMDRAELECLDREALIRRAEQAGVTRARILTRPELVDELLLRDAADEATKQRSRGFFGRARDLLARVVEKGLHLPDAADRIRSIGTPAPQRRAAPIALPTVTLAEIYVTQGHRDRAIETLEAVLAREPDHAAARALLDRLLDIAYSVPPPRMAPERESMFPTTGDESLSATSGDPSDECVAIPVDGQTLYVFWDVRERTLGSVRAAYPGGGVSLRLFVVVPTWDGPRSSEQDHDVETTVGDVFIRTLPPGCVTRAAIGWKEGDAFIPIAHSPALETPSGAPSPMVADALVRWTPDGTLPVGSADRDASAIDRALLRMRSAPAEGWRGREVFPVEGPDGSGERWVSAPSS